MNHSKLFTSISFFFLPIIFILFPSTSFPQSNRFALVIGNSEYMEIQKLKNPSNDANAISDSLIRLGFTVTKLVNANLNEMEDAVVKLGDNLSTSNSSIGFFYYAGHGIQSNNENFIIPVDGHIPSEYFLKTKALSVQEVLDTLQGAKNKLNIIVLDACRDNPFSWSRSTTRGLTVTGAQPASSIIVYATSAGSVALDGEGKNGIFTTELLKNLEVPDLDVKEIFERTGAQVQNITNGKQIPAIYSQFFGSAILTSNATDINSNSSSKIETLLSDDDIKVIKTGNASQVMALLSDKIKPEFKSKDGFTALYYSAAFNPDPSVINILIKAGAKVNAIEINQNTALHAAVATNTLEVIRALITCGWDVCAKNHSGLTPLMLAVMNNLDPAVISLLLSSGADINARGNSDERVFHLATENNSIDIIKIILEAGANINETDNNGITPLMAAAYNNPRPEVIDFLIDNGAQINTSSKYGWTPLIEAAFGNSNEKVIAELINKGADLNAKTNLDWSAAMESADNNQNPNVLKTLISAGANITKPNKDGWTPIFEAAGFNQNPNVLKVLLENGCNIGDRIKNKLSLLLMAAYWNSNPDMLKYLMSCGSRIDETTGDGWTPLMEAATNNKNPKITEFLINAGSNINYQKTDGWSVLMEAAANNDNVEICKLLLDAGAEVNQRNNKGGTALIVAASSNSNPEVIRFILSKGADPRIKDMSGKTAYDYLLTNNKFLDLELIKQIKGY